MATLGIGPNRRERPNAPNTPTLRGHHFPIRCFAHLSFIAGVKMQLVDVELDLKPTPLPEEIKRLLSDADRRIERFQHEHRDRPYAAFVPCDFVLAYHAIEQIEAFNLAAGHRFLEWGSGAGVVTCLASKVGFDAVGIEIEVPLVELASGLAEDHHCEVELLAGSFIVSDVEIDEYEQRDINWLRTEEAAAYEELGLDADDFDLIFAYPWPGEEDVVFDLFAECAAVGALLLTYHGQDGMRLQRKVN